MSLEIHEVLEFARKNDVIFDVIYEGGEYFIRANLDRVTAKYPVNVSDVSSLAGAVWAALAAVKAGIEFHTLHGYTPGLDLGQGYPRVGGSNGEKPNREVYEHAARNLRPPPVS